MSNYRIDNLQNNLPSLLIGSLYTVNEEYGYIRKKELTKLIHQNPYYLTSNILKPAKDIIIYDKPLLTSAKDLNNDSFLDNLGNVARIGYLQRKQREE